MFLRTVRRSSGCRDAFAKAVWRLLWYGVVAKYVLWKAEEKWKANGWGLPFGGQHDNEYVLRGMMWADNYWLFCDQRKIDMRAEWHH